MIEVVVPEQAPMASGDEQRALHDVRCRHCHRLLCRVEATGRLEIVCPYRDCRRMQTIRLGDHQARERGA